MNYLSLAHRESHQRWSTIASGLRTRARGQLNVFENQLLGMVDVYRMRSPWKRSQQVDLNQHLIEPKWDYNCLAVYLGCRNIYSLQTVFSISSPLLIHLLITNLRSIEDPWFWLIVVPGWIKFTPLPPPLILLLLLLSVLGTFRPVQNALIIFRIWPPINATARTRVWKGEPLMFARL